MVKVRGARVAWADYQALRRDFSELKSLSDGQIDDWITENFAYIGKEQLKLNGIRNSEIPVAPGDSVRIGYRPTGWGRAAVIPAPGGKGIIDLKGAGHANESLRLHQQVHQFKSLRTAEEISRFRVKDHSDGLMSLGEAIAEVSRQQAAQKLFDIHHAKNGTRLQTIESYFIIDLPFSILKDGDRSVPAALYARQAHVGRENYLRVPKEIYVDDFGSTQMDRYGAAVDFGGVHIRHPALSDRFGMQGPGKFDAQQSKPWAWGHEVAQAMTRKENPDRDAIRRHLKEMLEPIETEWQLSRKNLGEAATPEVIRELRKWSFSDPQWYAKLATLIDQEGSASAHEFIRHLLLLRAPTAEEKAEMVKVLSDPKSPTEAKRAVVRLLTYGTKVAEAALPAPLARELGKHFSKLSEADRKRVAPFLEHLDAQSYSTLVSGLSDKASEVRQASALRLSAEIRGKEGPWANRAKIEKGLAEVLQQEPIRDLRLSMYHAFRDLEPERDLRLNVYSKLAVADPYFQIRNETLNDLNELKPKREKIYRLLKDAFQAEPNMQNRLAISEALVTMRPKDPELHLQLLRAAELAEPIEMGALLSKLEGLELNDPRVKRELDRLTSHPDRDLANAAVHLGGNPYSQCAPLFKSIGD